MFLIAMRRLVAEADMAHLLGGAGGQFLYRAKHGFVAMTRITGSCDFFDRRGIGLKGDWLKRRRLPQKKRVPLLRSYAAVEVRQRIGQRRGWGRDAAVPAGDYLILGGCWQTRRGPLRASGEISEVRA